MGGGRLGEGNNFEQKNSSPFGRLSFVPFGRMKLFGDCKLRHGKTLKLKYYIFEKVKKITISNLYLVQYSHFNSLGAVYVCPNYFYLCEVKTW
jgi:hypothetical protein